MSIESGINSQIFEVGKKKISAKRAVMTFLLYSVVVALPNTHTFSYTFYAFSKRREQNDVFETS